jgi:hypothetical protein
MFSKRLDKDIRIGPVLSERGEPIPMHLRAGRILVEGAPGVEGYGADAARPDPKTMEPARRPVAPQCACYPAAVRSLRAFAAVLAAAFCLGAATTLLPSRVEEVARSVEQVRGKRFEHTVPATEIDMPELKRILRAKVGESFPASPAETLRTLAAFGLIEDSPNLLDKLVDFYASQVIAFYDPEPKRFYVVRGSKSLEAAGLEDQGGMAEKLIFSHELTHALQDESLRLDRRLKDLKDNGDAGLALESLLEGEATVVMVRVVMADLPAEAGDLEESLAPLLSAGALERANVPKDLPDYFVDQLFFPYVDGTAYVKRALKRNGWAEVDRLWKHPPATSAEILHDELRFAPATDLLPGDGARLAPAGMRFLYADTLGEWTIRFLLRKSLEQPAADDAAAGWRGDRIAFFGSGSSIAYVWRLRLESASAAEQFEATWRKVRAKKELITRSGRDLIVSSGFEKAPI